MAQDFDFNVNLPHDYYPAIGEFIFRCAQLESQLHEVLWRAIGIDNKQGRVLTIGTDAKVIRGMLRTVAGEASKGRWIPQSKKILIQEINSLVGKAKEFSDLRNKIAHGSWQSPVRGKASEVQLLYTKERDQKILAKYDPSVGVAYLHQACAKVRTLNMKAKTLIHDLTVFRSMPTSQLHPRNDMR